MGPGLIDRIVGRATYLDANVFIYAVENVEPYATLLRPLISAIVRRELQAA